MAQRERAVDRLADYVSATGLARTNLRELGRAAGVSDRMLLYYFENKEDVLAAVLQRISDRLSDRLGALLPNDRKLPPHALLAATAALLQESDVRSTVRLWLEIAAAANRGEEPYGAVAEAIGRHFIAWFDSHLDTKETARRKNEAAMIFAMIDGLAVVEMCLPAQSHRRALKAMIASLK